jgi:pimeloyl-ACP methyl ester carboxylesterase
MRSSVHQRDGLRLAVWESGEGLPILFQHGLCGDAGQPAEVFPPGLGWRSVTLECRGHGNSDAGAPEDFTIATFTEDLASLIEVRELAPAVVAGISMGAAMALRLAVTRPSFVRALILARPAWIDRPAPPNMQAYALVGSLLRQFAAEEARAKFEASETAHALAREAPDNLVSLRSFFFSREPVTTTLELLCRISADGPGVTRSQIETIAVPTMVIGTARDLAHPLAMAQQLAALIPRADMIEITPKSDSRERYREDFRAALQAFLKQLDNRIP